MSIEQHLKNCIIEQGSISIEEFMQTCLYHPDYGYYTTRQPIGERGDFVTAPEISQIFGEILGAWVLDTWQKMEKPVSWQLIEVGPGKGTLMADMLRTIEALDSEAYEAMQATLVELSPSLKITQRQTLEEHPNVTWANTVDDIDFSHPSILIGNEFLDAFPIKQYENTPNGFKQRMITLKKDALHIETAAEVTELNIQTEAKIVETHDAMESYLCKIKDKMKNGVALFIDYGDEGYGDTLQALHNHKKVNVLSHLGEADITSHVNFADVRRIFGIDKTSLVEPMGTFLTSLGYAARAAHLLTNAQTQAQKESIEQAAHRLLHPEQMGELFKAIAYQTHNLPLAGLTFVQQEGMQYNEAPLKTAS